MVIVCVLIFLVPLLNFLNIMLFGCLLGVRGSSFFSGLFSMLLFGMSLLLGLFYCNQFDVLVFNLGVWFKSSTLLVS